MATIAIGDILGNAEALDDVLGRLSGELVRGDTVVFLGDGRRFAGQSRGVAAPNTPRLNAALGEHAASVIAGFCRECANPERCRCRDSTRDG